MGLRSHWDSRINSPAELAAETRGEVGAKSNMPVAYYIYYDGSGGLLVFKSSNTLS